MSETKGHPHAHLMKLYAEDAMSHPEPWTLWEVKHLDTGQWEKLNKPPMWLSWLAYRRKSCTIRIGNRDVPEPMRTAPEIGTAIYMLSLINEPMFICMEWNGTEVDYRNLRRGVYHLTEEAITEHAKALIEVSGGAV